MEETRDVGNNLKDFLDISLGITEEEFVWVNRFISVEVERLKPSLS